MLNNLSRDFFAGLFGHLRGSLPRPGERPSVANVCGWKEKLNPQVFLFFILQWTKGFAMTCTLARASWIFFLPSWSFSFDFSNFSIWKRNRWALWISDGGRRRSRKEKKRIKQLPCCYFAESSPSRLWGVLSNCFFPQQSVRSGFWPPKLYSARKGTREPFMSITHRQVEQLPLPSQQRVHTQKVSSVITSRSRILFIVQLTVSVDCFWFSFICSVFKKEKESQKVPKIRM